MADVVGILEVDLLDAGEREIALALAGGAHAAVDGVAGAQAELPDLGGADVDVVGAGQVVGFGTTQESEAVLDHLKGAGAADLDAFLGQGFQDSAHHVLLAHGVRVFDVELFGEGHQVGGRLLLQLLKGHAGQAKLGDGLAGFGGLAVLDAVVGVLDQRIVVGFGGGRQLAGGRQLFDWFWGFWVLDFWGFDVSDVGHVRITLKRDSGPGTDRVFLEPLRR